MISITDASYLVYEDISSLNAYILNGGNINATTDDEAGMPLISLFVEDRRFDYVQLFIEHGADVNQFDANGKTPLHWAKENKDMISLLISAGANPHLKDAYGVSFYSQSTNAIKHLIDHGHQNKTQAIKKEHVRVAQINRPKKSNRGYMRRRSM